MRIQVFALAVFTTLAMPTHAAETALGPDIVTIVGNISKTNRASFDPFLDSLFKFHEKEFKKAYAFSYDALAALPQTTVRAQAENWPIAVTASGPKLSDVLQAAGVTPDATVQFLSLDGYALEMEPAKIKAKDWVLAISAQGRALGIGGRGPAWLLYDTGGKAVDEDVTGDWVYQLFLIEVQ